MALAPDKPSDPVKLGQQVEDRPTGPLNVDPALGGSPADDVIAGDAEEYVDGFSWRTVIGALFTLVLYGVAPVSLLVDVMATPARKRAIKAREAAELAARTAAASNPPHAGGEAAADAVAAVRKET